MQSSFTFLRVRGIPIGANWSWLFVFAFLVWTLSTRLFPSVTPDLETSTYWAMGLIATILFVVSLLLHELGHAFRAQREGMEIEGITLWLFGGVARFKGMFPSAGAEFRIAIAGPAVSALLAVGFGVLWLILNSADAPGALIGVTGYLGWINGILLGFNLVPALPLDGGRVLRAYLWHRQGNFAAATVSAARAGRAFGGVLIVFGVLSLLANADYGGLWFIFLGWFLIQAAQAEATFARFQEALRGMYVRNLMTPDPESVEPDRSIASFIDEVAHARGHSTYPVMEGDRLAGLMSLRLAAQVPPEQRQAKRVRDVMVQPENVPIVRPDDEVFAAAPALQRGPGRAVVVNDGRVVGLLSASDIARALELEQVRGPAAEPRARGTGIAVWIVVAAIILGATAFIGGFLYSPPVVVIRPGKAFDVSKDVRIRGVATDRVNGEYMLTSVAVEQPNGIGLALALIRSQDIVPQAAIVPRGVDPDRYFREQRNLFEESQLVAAAAAAKAAGKEVRINGTGARVLGIFPGSPAARVLKRGDVITAINSTPVKLSDALGRVISSRPTGTRFTLEIARDGKNMQVEIRSREGIIRGRPGIGVEVETRDFDIDLPFRVRFRPREIGGPSAGLTYALAVYDMLVPADIARGRAIATTGTIDLDGRVGPIGGVEEKTVAAERAGATLFLVPEDEVNDARGSKIDVQGVGTLQEALEVLKAKA